MLNKKQASIQDLLELNEPTVVRISEEFGEAKDASADSFGIVKTICKDMSQPEKELILKGFLICKVIVACHQRSLEQN